MPVPSIILQVCTIGRPETFLTSDAVEIPRPQDQTSASVLRESFCGRNRKALIRIWIESLARNSHNSASLKKKKRFIYSALGARSSPLPPFVESIVTLIVPFFFFSNLKLCSLTVKQTSRHSAGGGRRMWPTICFERHLTEGVQFNVSDSIQRFEQ